MRTPLIFSASFHVVIIAATLLSWPFIADDIPPSFTPIPVDIVYQIGEKTILPPEPEPEEEEPEQDAQAEPEEVELPQKVETITPPDPAPAEAEPLPQPAQAKEEAKSPPLPQRKPAPPEASKKEFDLTRLANILQDKSEPKPAPKQALQAKRPAGGQVTLSEIDALRAQIERCWRVPAGAPKPEDLVVRLRIQLTRDGRLMGPPELAENTQLRMMSDQFYRVAVESARRAVDKCQPYSMPVEKYAVWRDIEITFDPAQSIGR
jgi:outer membrane biosynthesis protein TonB